MPDDMHVFFSPNTLMSSFLSNLNEKKTTHILPCSLNPDHGLIRYNLKTPNTRNYSDLYLALFLLRVALIFIMSEYRAQICL